MGLIKVRKLHSRATYSKGAAGAGTPVQNNMKELYGILNLVNPARFEDPDDFLEEFGGGDAPPTVEQVHALQVHILLSVLFRTCKIMSSSGVKDHGYRNE